MYEQSSESAHACVVKYIQARLPSQARRAGLASQIRTCMGIFTGFHTDFCRSGYIIILL
jgi:hypothetical protein